jgi:thioredoxin-dependent peroxiredoxin
MSLTVGDKAPLFKGNNQDGKLVSLSDFKGKKVVLYFYPKDNTPGCTAQACNLKDNIGSLKKAGYVILGISSDSEKSHLKFKEKFELPFDLIADPEKIIHEQYGVWVEKSMYGRTYMGTARTTFIIDEKGIISKIIDKVKTKEHTSQIIQ